MDGVGFALGMERLLMARDSLGVCQPERPLADVFMVNLGQAAVDQGLAFAQALRHGLPGIRLRADFTGRSMKAQMRTANRLGTRITVIRGDDELTHGVAMCKDMTSSEQVECAPTDVPAWIRQRMQDSR